MELQYIAANKGDTIIPPPIDSGDKTATIVCHQAGYVCIFSDNAHLDYVAIHESRIDDLINALTSIKKNCAS